MSLIRLSTRIGKHRHLSSAYVWRGVDGYFYITVAADRPRRAMTADKDGLHGVKLTRDEFRYMVESACIQYGWGAKRK